MQLNVESQIETDLIPPSFYFNPVIYFPCKFCRQAFPTVDRLLKHKRRKHTWSELKGVKYIFFEERFVQDEFYSNNSLLLPDDFLEAKNSEEHETAISNHILVSSEENDDQTVVQIETSQFNTTIAIKEETILPNFETVTWFNCEESGNEVFIPCLTVKTESNSSISKLNPYVPLLRMTEKDIQDARKDLNDTSSRNLSGKIQEKQEQRKNNEQEQNYSSNSKKSQRRKNDTELVSASTTSSKVAIIDHTDEIHLLQSSQTEKQTDVENRFENANYFSISSLRTNFNNDFIILDVGSLSCTQKEIALTTSTMVNADQSLLAVQEQEPAPEPEVTEGNEPEPEPESDELLQDEREQVEDDLSIASVEALEELEFKYEPESWTEQEQVPNPEPIESRETITVVETESPPRRYNTRGSKQSRTYNEAEEFPCAKCSLIFFSQSELYEHTLFYCKKRVLSVGPEKETIICLDSESEQEWAENPGEDSEAETEVYEENDINASLSSGIPTAPMIEIPEDQSTISLKEWLKTYKNAFPNSHIFFDPDPLEEPDQDENPRSQTETILFPLRCKLCYKVFNNVYDEAMAKDHVMICWSNESAIRNYCFKCDKPFTKEDNFQKHNFIDHPKDQTAIETTFGCGICSISFRSSSDLIKHSEIHSEDRSTHSTDSFYSCTLCAKTFRRRDGFVNHTRLHHTREKPFSCPHFVGSEKCALKFCTRQQLIDHRRKKHPETIKEKKFPCTFCPRTFWSNYRLQLHMCKHTGVRPLKCAQEGCSRTFSLNFELKEHMRTHTGEKPFQCDACGKKFSIRCSFNRHCNIWCPNKDD